MTKRYSEAKRRALFKEQKRTRHALGVVAKLLCIGKAAAYPWAQRNKRTVGKVQRCGYGLGFSHRTFPVPYCSVNDSSVSSKSVVPFFWARRTR